MQVEVLDTHNVEGSTRINQPDNVMNTFLFSSSVEDGRISCRLGSLEPFHCVGSTTIIV